MQENIFRFDAIYGISQYILTLSAEHSTANERSGLHLPVDRVVSWMPEEFRIARVHAVYDNNSHGMAWEEAMEQYILAYGNENAALLFCHYNIVESVYDEDKQTEIPIFHNTAEINRIEFDVDKNSRLSVEDAELLCSLILRLQELSGGVLLINDPCGGRYPAEELKEHCRWRMF